VGLERERRRTRSILPDDVSLVKYFYQMGSGWWGGRGTQRGWNGMDFL